MPIKILFTLLCALLFTSPIFAQESTAPITGFARSFLTDEEIANATITVLETGLKLTTDDHGRFGPFHYPIGKPLTLKFEKFHYKSTQSATVTVPPEGLTENLTNLTFQVPSVETFYFMAAVIGAHFQDDKCHVVTTVTATGKTLDDVPQGEPGAKLVLTPNVDEPVFYFDIFKNGPFKGKTNPFTKGLVATSADGGAGYFNLPPRDEPYTLTAVKNGMVFSKAQFICRKGEFVNISPPRGPSVIQRA